MKLFKITLKSYRFQPFYVVAANADDAFQTVKIDLTDRDLGFNSERVLQTAELIAEDSDYPETDCRLMFADM